MDRLVSTRRLRPWRAAVAVAIAVGLLAALAPLAQPSAQGVVVTSPMPQPDSVVEAGAVRVSDDVAGTDQARLVVNGQTVDGDVEAGITVTLEAGVHTFEVTVGGDQVRAWPVYAADITAVQLPDDPLAVALAASGDVTRNRPVVLVNPDRPELALSGATVARGLAAALLPVIDGEVGEDLLDAIGQMRDAGDEIILLGGFDALSRDVVAALEETGYTVRRVGTGSAAAVAADAAAAFGTQRVFVRGGAARPRPLLVAPAAPLPAALEAAAYAAANDTALLVVEDGEVEPETTALLESGPPVLLASSLSPDVSAQLRDRLGADRVAEVDTRRVDRDGLWTVDAETDPGLALLATRSSAVDVGLVLDAGQASRVVAIERPTEVVAAGSGFTARAARAAAIDGTRGPVLEVSVDDTSRIVVDSDRPLERAAISVSLDGIEWPGEVQLDEQQLIWVPGARPAVTGSDGSAVLLATGVAEADDHLRHFSVEEEIDLITAGVTSAEGFQVAGGTGPVVGTGGGLVRYTVEIEPATGLDLGAVAAEAESILSEPNRGWTARGGWTFQRVGDPAQANIRVVVARPSTVDGFCGRVGLNTGGRLSCWDGRRAMLNLDRWNTGVAPFHTDLTVYRQYLVNHEFGHGLGFGHVTCPQAGTLAPVMSQQSKGLQGCVANGWPYPNGR
ncbi:DUF3152 domain-containing protein [Euzebya tangerina]|uniref:DUF3152 domain-containing protein n=1 Tax=Euzebya tangerina TaxID=591198 RepID=UPI002F2C4400